MRARLRFSSSRRFRAAAPGVVGTRARGTASAARSFSTSRSTASSRFRSWLRSSCATARRTAPALLATRRFCASVSALEASTSRIASTRVDDFCACWPPGPLERETLISISESGSVTERVTRIDSPSMASILLDIDGVLHVSGEPIPGALEAVSELRRAGHALRFVTNNSTRPRSLLAEELRGLGFELSDDELQTTPGAAARELAGKRVLALVMPADRARSRGLRARRARRRGRAHRRLRRVPRAESGLQLHEPRACVRRAPDRRRLLLHAQEQVVADAPGPDARLRGVRRGARVRDRGGGDRTREAEPVLLRGRARRARRRAGAARGSSPTMSRPTFAVRASSG